MIPSGFECVQYDENEREANTGEDLYGFILVLWQFSSVALRQTWATEEEKIS